MRGWFPISSSAVAGLSIALCACATRATEPPMVAEPEIPVEPEAVASTPWSTCLERFTPTGSPAVDIERIGRLCGTPNGQVPFAPPRMGKQVEAAPVTRYTLHAGGEGKCYRIYVVGDQTVVDIDLEVVAPSGERLAFDDERGAVAAIPRLAPLCLVEKGIYTIEVSVARGGGAYALQVWTN